MAVGLCSTNVVDAAPACRAGATDCVTAREFA